VSGRGRVLPWTWSYRTDFVFPNVPPGSFGEGAKLWLPGSCRQPDLTCFPSDPFAKSNNFGSEVALSKKQQARNYPRRGMSRICDQ